ncbi:hypothetical protein Poli38472_002161 [Pythium oligandrum]|uniref:Uncharacterized protein n=1 Tax=Pythium oligandrum TaxID=41045 RepID=A0A8K1CHA7_PYTOL|nr:hypothetical protein Poli38472_002161 [Pythium oligandrum]|eukprot:TMW63220.1 hypothetical protein Poli38472_002161 [Pythium oligandrum]
MHVQDELTGIKTAMLEMEIQRLEEAFDRQEEDGGQALDAAVEENARWLLQTWQDDRKFLQSILPLVVFRMFDEATKTKEREEEEIPSDGPIGRVIQTAIMITESDGCKEFLVRHVAGEFRTIMLALSTDDRRKDDVVRLMSTFIHVIGDHPIVVEALDDAVIRRYSSRELKKSFITVVDESDILSEEQKALLFLKMCQTEQITAIRELAARQLVHRAIDLPSTKELIVQVNDKSLKIRRIISECLMRIGIERLQSEVGGDELARLIVKIGGIVSGNSQESLLREFIIDYYAQASDLDELCGLSMRMDDAGAFRQPILSRVFRSSIGRVVTPSYFSNDRCEWMQE